MPGNRRQTASPAATCELANQHELIVCYAATTDQTTPINLTQHTYFNLKGAGEGTILGHELMINSKHFTPIGEGLIPTGEVRDVAGSPFDFSVRKPIGQDIEQGGQQLQFGLGYDHNWVLDQGNAQGEETLAAEVYEPTTGRRLEICTTEPSLQFYCGNFLDGRLKGKSGKEYRYRGGICLETQHFPNSPHQANFPSTLLEPGDT